MFIILLVRFPSSGENDIINTKFIKKYCKTCDKELELVLAYNDIWTTDHYQCPVCNGTYEIFALEKCECKYAHADGICRWPTLEGRLAHPLTTYREALEQLERTNPAQMTDYAKNKLEQLRKKGIK